MKKPTKDAYINDFAIRCFRNTGDGDYIAARMAFRTKLFVQFFWAAEQTIEKYIKCILMLNRHRAKDFKHNIQEGFKQLNERLPFQITLSKAEQEIFDHISGQDADRYLSLSYFIDGRDLAKFDCLVWKIRQYCRPLDVETIYSQPSKEVLLRNIGEIEDRLKAKSVDYRNWLAPGGYLEEIIRDKEHPAREHLIWQNSRFITRSRRTVKVSEMMAGENAPLWVRPELIDEVLKYMHIPKSYEAAYREHGFKRMLE